jgi:hypothetical protein
MMEISTSFWMGEKLMMFGPVYHAASFDNTINLLTFIEYPSTHD